MEERCPPIYDPAQLAEALGDNPALIAEVLSEFQDDLPRQLGVLELHYDNRAFSELAKGAHQLKGAALNVGAMALSATAMELQLAAEVDDTLRCSQLLGRIADEAKSFAKAVAGDT